MSDTKISGMTAATSASGADVFTLVQSSTNKKITFTNLLASITGLNVGHIDTTTPSNLAIRAISFGIDGGGSAIATGAKGIVTIPYDCTILGWYLGADQSGSAVLDVWKHAGAVPTVADTITASAKPTLSAAQYGSSSTLTGWTTTVTAGDVFRVNVDSASTVTMLSLVLKVKLRGT